MSRNPCDALAVYCYDHRLRQRHLDLLDALGVSADPFSQPGGARRVLALGGTDHNDIIVREAIDLAVRLHQIWQIILINHEDCGAYESAEMGSEETRHVQHADLVIATQRIEVAYPNRFTVRRFYLNLDGTFEELEDDSVLSAANANPL